MVGKSLIYPRTGDPRVAAGEGAQWWQESFSAAAVWRTCSIVGPVQGLAPCERVARFVLDVAWQMDGTTNTRRSQPQGPIDGSANAANPRQFGFNGYGMPGCVWLVLQVEPTHDVRQGASDLGAAHGGTRRHGAAVDAAAGDAPIEDKEAQVALLIQAVSTK